LRPADSLTPGEPAPRTQVRGDREQGHVDPDLGDDHPGCGGADPGDLVQLGDRVSERGDLGVDPGLDGSDVRSSASMRVRIWVNKNP